jgi:integrase
MKSSNQPAKNKRRRQRGTGSLRSVGNGKWQLRYMGESDIAFAPDKTTAAKLLDAFVARVRNGGIADGERMTVRNLAALYIEHKGRSKEPTTLAWYRRNLDTHVCPAIGDLKLRDLKAIHVQRMLDNARDASRTKRKGQPLGATSLRNLLVFTRAMLAWAIRQGLCNENVASKVEMPRQDHIERPALTPAHAGAILAAARGSDLYAIVATAIFTGLRRSELCGLRWDDLDLEAGTITVKRAAANVDRKVIVKSTKTRNSQRSDHLAPSVVLILAEHKREQLARYEVLFGPFDARKRQREGYVFALPRGEVWGPNELSRAFSRFILRKKLTHYRFHDLRHGYASLAFAAGIPLAVVSRSMGHASIGITANTYTHLLTDQKRESAAALDAFLAPAIVAATGTEKRA